MILIPNLNITPNFKIFMIYKIVYLTVKLPSKISYIPEKYINIKNLLLRTDSNHQIQISVLNCCLLIIHMLFIHSES